MNLPKPKTIYRVLHPLYSLFASITYFLGTGIAHYLGAHINWILFWLSLLGNLLFINVILLLTESFRIPGARPERDENQENQERLRVLYLQISLSGIALFFVFLLGLYLNHGINGSGLILNGINILILVFYAVPPFRLSEKGWGEICIAISVSTLLPAIAFLFQLKDFHRLLVWEVFPLTFLLIAHLMIADFPNYAGDLRSGRTTLLTRLTWPKAIQIHIILVIGAFVMITFSYLLGIPWKITWPVYLALPFALVQTLWLNNIANGGRPMWNFLVPLSAAVFCLSAYLLALAAWIS